jgi:hypothetical protein
VARVGEPFRYHAACERRQQPYHAALITIKDPDSAPIVNAFPTPKTLTKTVAYSTRDCSLNLRNTRNVTKPSTGVTRLAYRDVYDS